MFLGKIIVRGTKPFPSLTMDMNFLSNPLLTLAADKMEMLETQKLYFSYCPGTVIFTPKAVVNASIYYA